MQHGVQRGDTTNWQFEWAKDRLFDGGTLPEPHVYKQMHVGCHEFGCHKPKAASGSSCPSTNSESWWTWDDKCVLDHNTAIYFETCEDTSEVGNTAYSVYHAVEWSAPPV